MSNNHTPGPRRVRVVIGLLVILLLGLSLSRESLWIDELTTAALAAASSWPAFLLELQRTGSEMQMPLFSLYAWGWGQEFGTSEIALRAMNLPWLVLGVAAMAWWFRQLGILPGGLLLLSSPFLAYYVNEARPYTMTFATAALAFASLECLLTTSDTVPIGRLQPVRGVFLTALALCLGTSLLNLFLVPALGFYAFSYFTFRARGKEVASPRMQGATALGAFLRQHRSTGLSGLLLLLVFVLYYGASLVRGYGGQKQPFGAVNLGFSFYEWMGFMPLGAPRYLLRESPLSVALRPYMVPLLVGLLPWAALATWSLWTLRKGFRDACLARIVAAAIGGIGLLLIAAVAAPASLWGRHFMFAYPLLLALLARLLLPAEASRRAWPGVLLGALLITLFLVGDFRQRLLSCYGKDPFREAAQRSAALQDETGLPLVWVAYDYALTYYGAHFRRADRPEHIIHGAGWQPAQVERWTRDHPDYLLLLHRPDKCDPGDAWGTMLQRTAASVVWDYHGMRLYHSGIGAVSTPTVIPVPFGN